MGAASNRTLCIQEARAAKQIREGSPPGENAIDLSSDETMAAIYEPLGLEDGESSDDEVNMGMSTDTTNENGDDELYNLSSEPRSFFPFSSDQKSIVLDGAAFVVMG